ncbi:50S ribosomal protein L35 [Shigella flexneri]
MKNLRGAAKRFSKTGQVVLSASTITCVHSDQDELTKRKRHLRPKVIVSTADKPGSRVSAVRISR